MMTVQNPSRRAFSFHSIALLTAGFQSAHALAQQRNDNVEVQPMGNWIEYRQTQYRGAPILVHLRIGYERTIVMPEPVWQQNPDYRLPGCDVVVESDIVGFYPTEQFGFRSIKFSGEDSGDTYELRIKASVSGIRQPMQINRG